VRLPPKGEFTGFRCAVESGIVQRIVVFRFGRRSRDDTPGKHNARIAGAGGFRSRDDGVLAGPAGANHQHEPAWADRLR
jgi:hypothetical protein